MTAAKHTIIGLAALALMGAVPLGPAEAATTTIQAKAAVAKALTFAAKQNLDFGTIVLPAAPGSHTVSISMEGVLTCPSGLTCTGTARPAIYNLQGTNRMVVRIFAVPSDLVNAADGSTIRFTPVAPASVTLTNSGFPGNDFNLGGSIDIPSTAAGTYTGNIEVTVDYQ